MRNIKKSGGRLLAAALAAMLLLVGCSDAPALQNPENTSFESWAIYWYVCGSDLETRWGSASNDIIELQEPPLPNNVQVVFQTGGAATWNNDMMDSSALYRFERVAEGGISVVETAPLASMGSADTFADFLSFCADNYPADKVGLVLWNHGAGSGGGVCYDELFGNEYLHLADLQQAFYQVYGEGEQKPFEFIGFDTCLMASVDAAAACAPWAEYMVASEASEPDCGWNYEGWLSELAHNPGMNGEELGRIICDSYYEGCEAERVADTATLSVIDLAKIHAVVEAVDALGREGIAAALEGSASAFFASYGRGASKADYFSDDRCEMVDLVSLVSQNERLFPETAASIKKSVADCVVYRVEGPYSADSNGLSVYYPYTMNEAQYQNFEHSAAAPGISYLYELLFTGGLSGDAQDYLSQADNPLLSDLLHQDGYFADVSQLGLEDYPVDIVEIEGASYAQLNIGAAAADALERVTFMLANFLDEGTVVMLGEESDVDCNWNNGVFTDNFRGVWGAIDGYLVTMEVTAVTDDYILYEVPIRINGDMYALTVAYIFDTQEYQILTATPEVGEAGIPQKQQRLLMPGDEITTLFYVMDDEYEGYYENETFTFAADSAFEEIDLADGEYALLFVMTDYRSETYMSELVSVTIEDGNFAIEGY